MVVGAHSRIRELEDLVHSEKRLHKDGGVRGLIEKGGLASSLVEVDVLAIVRGDMH